VIINIRGTSGSGKSTLVRRVMELYKGGKTRVMADGRKQPIGYIMHSPAGRPLAVVGHYETDCGGCDTISQMETIFENAAKADQLGMDVLFEGLLISADVNRTVALHKVAKRGMQVVALTTPLEQCLADVNKRRKGAYEKRINALSSENTALAEAGRKLRELPPERGDVNPANTTSKFKGVKQSLVRLRDAGVKTHELNREAAFTLIANLYGWEDINQGDGDPYWTR
jgi:energy-coupling factor transporter ATP-binding protein EcfA2